MKIKEFILQPTGLVFALLVIALVVIIQFGIVASIEARTKVAEGPCTFKSLSESGRSTIRLNLDCNGTEAWTQNTEVILGYLAKPGPLICSSWASSRASCEVPK